MRELLIILRTKAVMAVAGMTDLRWQAVGKNLSSAVILFAFAVAVFLLGRLTGTAVINQGRLPVPLMENLLSLATFLFLVTIHIINLLVSVATLYSSAEVEFLIGLPIPAEGIFLMRALETALSSSAVLGLLAAAGLLGWGSAFHIPAAGVFLFLFTVFLPLVAIAAITAVLVSLMILRLSRHIGPVAATGMAVVIYTVPTLVLTLGSDPVAGLSHARADLLQGALPFGGEWVVGLPPHYWVVTFLGHAARGEWWEAAGIAAALTSTMLLLVALTRVLARRWYLPAWFDAGEFRTRRSGRRRTARVSVMSFGRPLGLRPSLEVFLKRDFWMFMRDPVQRLHLFLMGVMLAGYLYSLVHADALRSMPGGFVMSYLVILLFNGFLLASAALRFVFPSTSMEGKAFWCVRTAPISLAKLFGYKFAGSLAFMAVLGTLLAAGMIGSFRTGGVLGAVAAVVTIAVTIGLTGVNLGAGAYFSSRHEHDPLRVASSQGASITFLASLVYLGVSVVMVALPVYSYVGQRGLGQGFGFGPFLLPLSAVLLFSLVTALAATGLGLRSLRSAE